MISGNRNVTDVRFPPLWRVIWSVSIWKGVLLLVVLVAPFIIPATGAFFPNSINRASLPESVWVWGNFDGAHYVTIAQSGYFTSLVPFFPFFPYLIKMTVEVTHLPYLIAGQVISVASFWLMLLVVYYLLQIDRLERMFGSFLLIVITFPTSFYYAAIYNDAPFFLLATLTILFARRKNWMLAAASGALATLTRLNGLALIFLVLAEYARPFYSTLGIWNFRTVMTTFAKTALALAKNHAALLAVFASPLAFCAYLVWVERSFGSWQLVFTSMSVWQQDKFVFPLQVVWRYIGILTNVTPADESFWRAGLELSFVSLYICIIIYSFRRIRFSYWFFMVLSFLIPSMTGTFQGMPRYGLHLYPFFLALTILVSTAPRWLRLVYYLGATTLLVVMLAYFSRGYFIA